MKAVKELMGHSTIEMTMRCSHLSPEARRDAVALLDRDARTGEKGADDDEAFERREPITAEERAVFQATAREHWEKILTEEEAERKKQGGPVLDKEDLARIRRSAIQ